MAVYFKIVEGKPAAYFILKKWFALIFRHAYYKKIHVKGRENLPPEGTPVLLVSNHQNGINDALLIDFAGLPNRRPMVFLARADAFKKPFIAKILNFCKVMPVFRQRDGRDNLGENQAIFDESAKLIRLGFPVALFPEGGHQEGHYLVPLKKGFARIAFEAAEQIGFPEDMTVVPVGNHYSDYFATRAEACVTFGRPIALKNYYDLYRENPPKALNALAADVAPAIRALMLDLPEPEHYETYDYLRELVRPHICAKNGLRRRYLPDALKADRVLADRLRSSSPEAAEEIRNKTVLLKESIGRLKLSTAEAARRLSSPLSLLREAFERLKDIVLLAAGLPFALYGMCFSLVPVWLGHNLAHKMARKNIMLQAGIDFVLSNMLLQGLFYLIYIILYWTLFAHYGVWVFLGLLLSWMFSRAFWQDYVQFAVRAWQRLKGRFKRRKLSALEPAYRALCLDCTGN